MLNVVNNQHPILLFDGVCNFCNASVQWVLLRDKAGIFRFAALQSDAGQAILQHHGLDHQNLDSVVLVDQQKVFLRSDFSRQGLNTTRLAIFSLLSSASKYPTQE